jgi:plasmid stabilization system protein ParE
MVCKVSWTPKALETYISNINYLESAWTEREIKKFIDTVDKKIKTLSAQPQIGSPRNKRQTNIRRTIVHKRISLISPLAPKKRN